MTTDERIDAIAMHLEIVAGMQEANERAIANLAERVDGLTGKVETLTERTIQAMDAINRLANIAAAHEERIDRLEGQ